MQLTATRTAKSAGRILALLGVLAGYGALAAGAAAGPAPSPPTITAKPANPTNQTSASFSFTSSGGGTFQCKLDAAAFAACASPTTYPGPLAPGSHTFQVKTVQGSQQSSPTSYTWTIDTTSPPQPSLTSTPANPTTSNAASFSFSDTESGVSFECKLDAGAFAACTSPKAHSALAFGSHTFSVRAKDAAGNVSSPASYTWSVVPLAPTITAKPANPTNQTAASFSFSTSQSGVAFACKLDGGSFTSCTSPATYMGPLGASSHTFQVKAVAGSAESSPTAYTWLIDLTQPPAPVILSEPTNPSGSASALFDFMDGESPVTFQCKLDAGAYAACMPPKVYGGLSNSSHTFSVQAVDPAGNVSTATSRTWTVDTVAPTTPVFTQTPPDPTPSVISTFQWTVSEPGLTWECSKENGAFQPCGNPHTYSVTATSNGEHQFMVRAVDAAGNRSVAASYKWKVDRTEEAPFTISGSVAGLVIGQTKSISLTLTNPNTVPIYVTALTVTISPNSTPAGCASAGNVQLTQPTGVSSGTPLTVPASDTISVPAAQLPTIKLVNLPSVNQDVCKNKSFTLTYSGSAHS